MRTAGETPQRYSLLFPGGAAVHLSASVTVVVDCETTTHKLYSLVIVRDLLKLWFGSFLGLQFNSHAV